MPRRKRLTWKQAKSRFEIHLRARNLSPKTVYCYGLEVDRLADSLGLQGPHEVRVDHLRDYQAGLLSGETSRSGRPLSSRSVYRVRCNLSTFFTWLVEEGFLKESPARRLERPKRSSPLPGCVLTEKEAERLLAAADATTPGGLRDRAIVELLYATGLRRAELVALDLEDVSRPDRLVRVRHGKGDKARVIPLIRSASLRVERYLADARPKLLASYPADARPHDREDDAQRALLLTAWGRRIGAATVAKVLKRLAKKAGIDEGKAVTPHTIRRSFATHLMRGKVNLRSIQLLLGHEKLSTTATYLRLDAEELRREILLHHPRERIDP